MEEDTRPRAIFRRCGFRPGPNPGRRPNPACAVVVSDFGLNEGDMDFPVQMRGEIALGTRRHGLLRGCLLMARRDHRKRDNRATLARSARFFQFKIKHGFSDGAEQVFELASRRKVRPAAALDVVVKLPDFPSGRLGHDGKDMQ